MKIDSSEMKGSAVMEGAPAIRCPHAAGVLLWGIDDIGAPLTGSSSVAKGCLLIGIGKREDGTQYVKESMNAAGDGVATWDGKTWTLEESETTYPRKHFSGGHIKIGGKKTPKPWITEDGYTLCQATCPMMIDEWWMLTKQGECCSIREQGDVVEGGPHDQCFRCEWRG